MTACVDLRDRPKNAKILEQLEKAQKAPNGIHAAFCFR
jgi:hypothetical protein